MPTRLALIPVHIVFASAVFAQLPHPTSDGFDLANGWKITPAGKAVWTEDLVLKLVTAPDGKVVIASHSGYNPHGVVVIDTKTQEVIQRIGLKTTWMGMAWSRDGKTLGYWIRFYTLDGFAPAPGVGAWAITSARARRWRRDGRPRSTLEST